MSMKQECALYVRRGSILHSTTAYVIPFSVLSKPATHHIFHWIDDRFLSSIVDGRFGLRMEGILHSMGRGFQIESCLPTYGLVVTHFI